ncbi:MAG TPA: TAXI family TRAP transporter solute-binding subunit [Desulfobacteraceae bacterium]|nr:TAXI family TRAP transporter solute-binding subunit [Desulfobacteraceae bacterium]HPJ67890.1 TAXI family TRAP transporter solute-binding subunit [Desulfobacteraceae bacterium]HPQ28772.1 TAXI family TRAP transporter solute-binding subunit [Desulfobacteraceae bacterium]
MERWNIPKLMKILCFVFLLTVSTFQSAEAKTSSLPPVLSISTHGIGSKYYALGSGLASVLSAHLSTEFKVMPTSGPGEWLPMITTQEADMGMANNYDCMFGWLEKGSPIRLITNGTPNINGIIVSIGSGIKTGNDLRGKRYVGIYPGSAAQTAQAHAALANFGLTPNDVKMMSMPGASQGIKAVTEGRADANGASVIGMGVITELDAVKGALFLSFDPSPTAAKRYADIFPAVPIKIVPAPDRSGIREPTYLMKYETYLVGSKLIPEDVVYEIVKTLWENNKELWPIHAGLKEWKTDQFVTKYATVPYHPGAIRFYKEKGVWGNEMDNIQQSLLNKEK